MTIALLIVGAILFSLMAALSTWLIRRGGAEPAARANGRAPDPTEERRAQATARRR